MNTVRPVRTSMSRVLLALSLILTLEQSTALAQGSLTPPGAPAPTMKSLEQIEPRIPISSAPLTITNPGSYYLTTNLNVRTNDAIDVANVNGVTLDLSGFTISSTAASPNGTGILISNCTDVTVFNGHIRGGVTNNGNGTFGGGGFANGISGFGGASYNLRVSGVTVSGCLTYGIALPQSSSTSIESCVAQNIGNYSLQADTICRSTANDGYYGVVANQASDCFANCYEAAIYCNGTANNCTGYSTSGIGIYCICANNCYGQSGTSDGVDAVTIHNCYGVTSGSAYGIVGYVVTDSYGYSVGSTGIYAYNIASACEAETGLSSANGFALYTLNASFCTANHSGNAAIYATVANGCYAQSGTNQITFKYNMP